MVWSRWDCIPREGRPCMAFRGTSVSAGLSSRAACYQLRHVLLALGLGLVNPLQHWQQGVLMVLGVPHAEPHEELELAVEDFRDHMTEYEKRLGDLRRYRNVGHGECLYDLVDTQDIWPTLQKIAEAGFPIIGQYVNIGAHDGFTDDPLYNYSYNSQALGIAIERDPEQCERHKANLPDVNVVCSEVTPQNVLPLVRQGLQGQDIDVLKIDIDSYDCPVLERIAPKVRATMIMVETNPSIPPPYQWAMLYDPDLWNFFESFRNPVEVPVRGCSLAYEIQVLRRYGYDLLAFDGHDAIFTHESVRRAFHPHQLPVDEFDCYAHSLIVANGIPINLTRQWFFKESDVHKTLPEIWRFFVDWMAANSPILFPFALRV
ncbi:unnamed protein product [Effrenium voratum]|nr:unnamed protein product [Effrenium voratum]